MSPALPQLDVEDRLSADVEVSSNLRLHSVVLANGPDVIRGQVGLVVPLTHRPELTSQPYLFRQIVCHDMSPAHAPLDHADVVARDIVPFRQDVPVFFGCKDGFDIFLSEE